MLGTERHLAKWALLLATPLLLTLASCGTGAVGGPAPAGSPPSGALLAQPAMGTAPFGTTLEHSFDDPQPQSASYQWEWDTDGDGDMDMVTSGPGQPQLALNFPQPGAFKVKLKVSGKDANGNDYVLEHEITIEVE